MFKRKKIFCTGGHGFIGSNLVKDLQDKYNLVVWGKDICEGINIKNDFDIIYHLAANTDTRFPNDAEMYRNNILCFIEVIKFALQNKKTKLVYASSGSVTGCEENRIVNAYADSKIICDEIAQFYFDKMKIVGLRFMNVYGKGELMKGKMASMITQWRTQVQNGERPKIFDGEFKRDFVYVKDVIKAMKQAVKLKNGIYDVGTGMAIDFFDVLNIIRREMNTGIEPIVIPNPYLGKYQKFTKANIGWGFKPDYTVESGIKDYFQNYE